MQIFIDYIAKSIAKYISFLKRLMRFTINILYVKLTISLTAISNKQFQYKGKKIYVIKVTVAE